MTEKRQEGPRRTPAMAEYLVHIYVQLREGKRLVGARLAEEIGVSPPAVTQAVRRMARDGLVTQEYDFGVQLTAKGRAMAEATLRRHYLLERLLVDQLGYNWAEADREADRLEHSLSPQLEQHLYERLGRPATCPHGNPFPGSPQERMLIEARTLASAQAGERITMLRVTEEGEKKPELMQLLLEGGFLPHTQGRVVLVDASTRMLRLEGPQKTVDILLALAELVRVSEPAGR